MSASHFESSRPVDGPLFINRTAELARLDAALDKLSSGRSAFIAVLGLRKLGKTSLFYEWMRRNHARPGIAFVLVECWSWPDPDDFFREYLRLTLNAALAAGDLISELGLIPHENEQGRLVEAAMVAAEKGLKGLGEGLRLKADYDDLRDRAAAYRAVTRLPETLAARDGLYFQFILDEFQAIESFDGFKAVKTGLGSVYAMLREEWQSQRRCNYLVSGSAVSMLRQIIEDPSAPFFQHFTSMPLGPLAKEDALKLLSDFSKRSDRAIPPELCQEAIRVFGTNPYYLQVVGEEMVLEAAGEPIGPDVWKRACQRVLFESSGRLYQYFERTHARVVGNSALLEKILISLAAGPKRGSEIAKALGTTQNKLSPKLPVLERQDVLRKNDARYELCDSCYGLWLQAARGALPRVTAPLLIGNESEQRVAREIAKQGVGLIYQSKASRGSFDLLALYQAYQIGVQVKKVKEFPAYVSQRELGRMHRDAKQMGWTPALAFDSGDEILFHRLTAGAPTKRGRRFDRGDALGHILEVLDATEAEA